MNKKIKKPVGKFGVKPLSKEDAQQLWQCLFRFPDDPVHKQMLDKLLGGEFVYFQNILAINAAFQEILELRFLLQKLGINPNVSNLSKIEVKDIK